MTVSAANSRNHVYLQDIQRLDPREAGWGIRAAVDITTRPHQDTRFLSGATIDAAMGTLRKSTSRDSLKSAVRAIHGRMSDVGPPQREALGVAVSAATAWLDSHQAAGQTAYLDRRREFMAAVQRLAPQMTGVVPAEAAAAGDSHIHHDAEHVRAHPVRDGHVYDQKRPPVHKNPLPAM